MPVGRPISLAIIAPAVLVGADKMVAGVVVNTRKAGG